MANCINYNCADELGVQELLDCDGDNLGGASAVIFLACNHTITDPSDEAQIATNISNQTAWLYKDVEIGIGKASAVKITPPSGCAVEKVINYNRSGTYRDGNVNATNITNYNALFNGTPLGGMIIFECAANDGVGQVTWIDAEVTFEGDRVLPVSQTEIQVFDATFMWINKYMPMIYAVPPGIFD